jgi:PTH1 family peptidyl-tRNA hydrolase
MFDFFKKKKTAKMLLMVGLGNPGQKYQDNRHNIGFMAIDAIREELGFSKYKTKFQGEVSEGSYGGKKIILLKPQTMMNNSGQSVQAAAKFYKVPSESIVVFHDELDLAPSKIRIKIGGGNAGHNGLRSIQSHLSTPDFKRVRLGIGHPGNKKAVHSFVLKNFTKSEEKWLSPLIQGIQLHINLLIDDQDSDFMSKVSAYIQE